MSLSRMKATTWRWVWSPPFLAVVMTFSATGRSALALASVVTIPSAATSDATRLPIIAFWWAASPPKRWPRLGVARISALLDPQRQPALVQLGQHLVERLLPEVGDGEQIIRGLLDELADGVDLRPLQAVAGALRPVGVLDREVEVG